MTRLALCFTCKERFRCRASSSYCNPCEKYHRRNREKKGIRLSTPRDRYGLTKTEAKILRLLFRLKSNKLVAKALGCHHYTVAMHRAAILMKSGCKNSFHLGVWAERRGYGRAQ